MQTVCESSSRTGFSGERPTAGADEDVGEEELVDEEPDEELELIVVVAIVVKPVLVTAGGDPSAATGVEKGANLIKKQPRNGRVVYVVLSIGF